MPLGDMRIIGIYNVEVNFWQVFCGEQWRQTILRFNIVFDQNDTHLYNLFIMLNTKILLSIFIVLYKQYSKAKLQTSFWWPHMLHVGMSHECSSHHILW